MNRHAWLDALWRDTRYAVRTVRRSPGFAATAVVSLAVGSAAATGLFSVVNAALLHPFPFADSDRIVTLGAIDRARRAVFLSRLDNSSPCNTATSSTAR